MAIAKKSLTVNPITCLQFKYQDMPLKGSTSECEELTGYGYVANGSVLVGVQQSILLYYQLDHMGNSSHGLTTASLHDLRMSGHLPTLEGNDQFIIKEMTAHSSEQHQELVVQLSKFKQYRCANIVQLVDSHTLQSNSLCSIIIHTYAVMLKPAFTLPAYLAHLHATKTALCNKTLTKLLIDLLRALIFLRQEGNEAQRITQDMIFIDREQNGEVMAKLMNPFFRECTYEPEESRGALADLGALFKKYLRFELHTQDLIQTISKMATSEITLEELEQKYAVNDSRKGRVRLKITRNGRNEPYDRTSRAQRQSLTSVVSDGSSLLIEGGDASDFALKEFYQNLEGEISNITEVQNSDPLLTSYTLQEFNISHQFPKKYINGKAFRKALRTLGSESYSARSEEKQNITRDQSLKENIRMQSRQMLLLQSAKLVQSFIGEA